VVTLLISIYRSPTTTNLSQLTSSSISSSKWRQSLASNSPSISAVTTSVPCPLTTKLQRQSTMPLRLKILVRDMLMARISTTLHRRCSNSFSLLEMTLSLSWLTIAQLLIKRKSTTTSVLTASPSPLSSLRSAVWASPFPLRLSRLSTSLISSPSY
jgi:hypothetical protein